MTEQEKVDTSDYEFRPADNALASALDTAERLAKEADQKFCDAFGGDGETSAYWLTMAIAEIRAALARAAPPVPVEPVTAELDNGGITGAFLAINAADGRVMGDFDTREEAADLCAELHDGRVLYFVAMRVQNTSDAAAVAEHYVPEGQTMPCGDAQALLSLADRTALVVAGAALRAPATVTEAMVQACIDYELSTYGRPAFTPIVLEQARKFYRGVLTAALAAPGAR